MRPLRIILSVSLLFLIIPVSVYSCIYLVDARRAALSPLPSIRIGAGRAGEPRHRFAEALKEAAWDEHQLPVEIRDEAWVDADEIDRVASGELDAAIVHGGMGPRSGVLQAATLFTDSLHLLVRDRWANGGLLGLNGLRFDMGEPGSGTRRLATKVIEFAGITARPHVVLKPTDRDDHRPASEADDVIFLLSGVPSEAVKRRVATGGYRLMEIPLAETMFLTNRDVQESKIPRYVYRFLDGKDGAVPPSTIQTVGSRLLLIVGAKVAESREESILKLIRTIYREDFARGTNLPEVHEADLTRNPEYPLCSAARKFLGRNQSIITSENVQMIDGLHNLVFAALAALAFGMAWLARFLWPGSFPRHLRATIALSRRLDALTTGGPRSGSDGDLATIGDDLQKLQRTVIDEFATGRLRSRDQFVRLKVSLDSIATRLRKSGWVDLDPT